MPNLVIICTVCLLTVVSRSNSLTNSDIRDILDVLRSNKHDSTSSESDSSDSDEDSFERRGGTKFLRTQDVLELIKKHNNKKKLNNRFLNNNQYQLPYPGKLKVRNENDLSNDLLLFNKYGNKKSPYLDGSKPNLVQQLFNNYVADQTKSVQSFSPNRLLTPVTLKDEHGRGQTDGQNEYSKIFVLLDPLALQKNENKNDVTSLVSKILSASSATNEKSRHEMNKGQHFYKGFSVKDDFLSRRFRQNSKESYGGNSMSDEPIKRRPKNNYESYGGGGSMGGRTAIPYVRLRGDIYERDH